LDTLEQATPLRRIAARQTFDECRAVGLEERRQQPVVFDAGERGTPRGTGRRTFGLTFDDRAVERLERFAKVPREPRPRHRGIELLEAHAHRARGTDGAPEQTLERAALCRIERRQRESVVALRLL